MPGQRILLVEDDDDNREILALALRGAGYIVDAAATAAQAHVALMGLRYALVIADWRLPDGDGTLVAKYAELFGAKTFVMSGYLLRMPSATIDARQTLMKPIRPSELVTAVLDCIGGPAEHSA
jgi:DNA-binding response OmpR family regulator